MNFHGMLSIYNHLTYCDSKNISKEKLLNMRGVSVSSMQLALKATCESTACKMIFISVQK